MEQNLNIEKVLDILKSKRIIIFFIILVFILLGYIYTSYFIVPEYKTTETLLLIPNEDKISNSELKLDSELISTYVNIAKSSDILNKVKDNLNLNMTEAELIECIEINSKEDTYIIEINVYNEDPQTAVNIAKELTNLFMDEVKEIYNLKNIGIIDEAELPSNPYNINYQRYMSISGMLGIVIAGIYISIIYMFDNTVKEENIERFTNLKMLGKIPVNNKNNDELILGDDSKSYIIEYINAIRTNIMYMNSMSKVKTILITSCLQGEGKSWTSANIAVAFAKSNKKVLLVDADLRKGRSNKIFHVNNDDGLSNYLYAMTGDVKKDVLLCEKYIKETKIPNLHIITNGTIPPNPSEIIGSNYMIELLSIFSNAYDIIIIDAPPCKLVADSIILSTIADSTIIVAEDNKTKIKDLVDVKKAIQVVNGKITGVILNKKKIDDKKYGQSYYRGIENCKQEELKEENILKVDDIIRNLKKSTQKIEKDIIDRKNRAENEKRNTHKTPKNEKSLNEEEIQINQYIQEARATLDDINIKFNKYEAKNKLEEREMNKFINSKIESKLDDIKVHLEEKIENILNTEINDEDKFQNLNQEIEKKIKLINNNIKDLKQLNECKFEKMEKETETSKEKILKIIEDNNNKIKNIQIEKINETMDNIISNNNNEINEMKVQEEKNKEEMSLLIEKSMNEIRNNYEKEITQINDILQSIQNNYAELTKSIKSKKEKQKETNKSNIIYMNSAKRKNKYSINEDIPYYELQRNAVYVIPINHKKSEEFDMNLEEESFGSFIG